MNKFLKIYLTALIFLLLVSCNNWLELLPTDGLVRDEYWKSKEDLKATLMGAYQQFASMDDQLFLYGELRGGMIAYDVNAIAGYRNIIEGNIFPDNALCNWSDFYVVINYCNSILKYAPVIYETDKTFTDYQLKGIEAEAYFLRSLAYFYLVRIFGNIPLVLEAAESDGINFFLPTSEPDEILDKITSDLKLARQGVTHDYGSLKNNKGRATMAALNALLADIALWRFNYQECLNYINEIENEGIEVMLYGSWFDIFYPGNSLESIFEFQFDASLGQENKTYNLTFFLRNFKGSEYAIKVLNPLISKEIIRGEGSMRAKDSKIWKYAGGEGDGLTLRPGVENKSGNWIVYRMSDVKLMKAEALSQLERFEEALFTINDLRGKRFMNPIVVTFSASAFEDAILEERAKELAFEGKRWFDLLRLGRRNDFQRKNDLIEKIIENVSSTQKLLMAAKLSNPLGWYMPIMADELERNYNLEQNPYYAGYANNK